MPDQFGRLMQQVAMARQSGGMQQRQGYVHEVKEAGGERKCRMVLGFGKDGTPWLSPWLNTEEHRGGSASQQLVEVGQAMIATCIGSMGFRNATLSPAAESISNPQPPHAPQFNGDSTSNGSKVRTATNKPSQQSGGGTSLLGSTEVLTADGFKNIKDIQLGDKLLSCPTGSASMKPVEDTVVAIQKALTKKPLFTLSYDGGRLCCTGEHGIWIDSRRQYLAADRLGFLDKLRNFDGKLTAIVSLLPHEVEQATVYDLTVEKNGNFYARDGSDGDAILVHNQAGGGGGGGGSGGSSDTHSIWIDNQAEQRQQHQEQSGGYQQAGNGGSSSSSQGGQQSQQNKPDPKVIHHLNDDGSGTIRTDTTSRVMSAPKGAKLECKSGTAYAVVTPQGLHIVKKPWIIGKDPVPNNDSV